MIAEIGHIPDAAMLGMGELIRKDLEQFLGANNGLRPILNRKFDSWGVYASRAIRFPDNREETCIEEAGIRRDCEKHIGEYSRPLDSERVVVLAHPFYIHFAHMDRLDTTGHLAQVSKYTEEIKRLIEKRKGGGFNLVLFEDSVFYIKATSLLLERGLVDDVILTKPDKGYADDESRLGILNGRKISMGGMYNGICLRHSLKDVSKKVSSRSLNVIQDLVLNSPLDYGELECEYVLCAENFPKITLEQFLEGLRLQTAGVAA